MKELNIVNITFICPHLSGPQCNSQFITANYKDILKDALGTDFYFNLEDKKINNFFMKYKKRFDREPTADAVYAYEDIIIFDKVIQLCYNSNKLTECAREKLLVEEFNGVDGKLRFNRLGVVERKTAIFKFDGNDWVILNKK